MTMICRMKAVKRHTVENSSRTISRVLLVNIDAVLDHPAMEWYRNGVYSRNLRIYFWFLPILARYCCCYTQIPLWIWMTVGVDPMVSHEDGTRPSALALLKLSHDPLLLSHSSSCEGVSSIIGARPLVLNEFCVFLTTVHGNLGQLMSFEWNLDHQCACPFSPGQSAPAANYQIQRFRKTGSTLSFRPAQRLSVHECVSSPEPNSLRHREAKQLELAPMPQDDRRPQCGCWYGIELLFIPRGMTNPLQPSADMSSALKSIHRKLFDLSCGDDLRRWAWQVCAENHQTSDEDWDGLWSTKREHDSRFIWWGCNTWCSSHHRMIFPERVSWLGGVNFCEDSDSDSDPRSGRRFFR
jgi:hypothetical protein